jgi:hypothetical protein
MKKISILFVLLLFCVSTFAQQTENKKKLGVFTSVDLQSKSIWLGWDLSNNKAAYIPCISLDLWQTGFETAFWASVPMDREDKYFDDLEIFFKYNHNLFAEQKGEINFHGYVDYIWFPKQDDFPHRPILNEDNTYIAQTGLKQIWKFNIGVSFNKLIHIGKNFIIPAYNIYYITPANTAYFQPGSVHDLSFTYNTALGNIASLKLSNNTLYHSRIFGVEALSINLTSAVVSFPFGKGFSVNTQINYQLSFEDAVNDENEFWGGAGLSYSF